MHIYEELTQPTVATHSLICKIEHEDQPHLNAIVVRGSSLLQLYRIHSQDSKKWSVQCTRSLNLQGEIGETTQYLSFFMQVPLDGTVTSLGVLHKDGKPYLVISFKYAKLVVLQWNERARTFDPISLHYYEKSLEDLHFPNLDFPAKLSIEPNSQCVALWYQRDKLALLPFPEEEDDESDTEQMFSPSIVLDPPQLDASCRNIVDVQFLPGYNEPTLAVIYQKDPRTWTGTLPLVKDNLHYLTISIDVYRQYSTKLVDIPGLPFDINRIVPLSSPIEGSFLIGPSHLIFIDSSGSVIASAVNQFASKTSDFPAADESRLKLDLNGAQLAQIPGSLHCILIAANGDAYSIDFEVDGLRPYCFSIKALNLPMKITNPSSVDAQGGSIVVTSSNSSAVMLGYTLDPVEEEEPEDDMQDEFNEIYESKLVSTVLNVTLQDALMSVGPITDITVIESQEPNVFASFGAGVNSGVALFSRGIWPTSEKFHTDPLSEVWSIGSYLVATTEAETKLYNISPFRTIYREFPDFVRSRNTLDIRETNSQIIHVTGGGITVYDTHFKKLTAYEVPKQLYAGAISDNKILCLGDGVDLYEVNGNKIVHVAKVSEKADKLAIFHDHIVVVASTKVGLFKKGGLTWYDFTDLAYSIEPTTEPPTESVLKLEISVSDLGCSVEKQVVFTVAVQGVCALYAFSNNTFSRIYSVPWCADMVPVPIELGDYSAIVLSGDTPTVLLKCYNSPVRIHRIRTRKVHGAAGHRNQILYTDLYQRLRTIDFDPNWDFVSVEWPVFKKFIGASISCAAYSETAEVICIGVNHPVERKLKVEEPQDDEDEDMQEVEEVSGEDPVPKAEVFRGEIQVLNPYNLKTLETIELEETQTIMCARCVQLEIGANTNVSKEFLAIGTALLQDEDTVCNGHFKLYSIGEIVPDPSRPDVRHKIKLVSTTLVAGAVTALCEVMGRIAVGQGQRILMRGVQEDHTVESIAFLDTEMYISSLKAIRNVILTGDLYRSVWVVNYGWEPHRLDVLGKDLGTSGVVCAETVSSEEREDFSLVASDSSGRIRVLQYDPDNVESLGGSKLVLLSELYIGKIVNAMRMVYGKYKDLGLIGGTNDGALISVMPMDEVDYRSLYVVTQQMMDKEQPPACLNPRMHQSMGCQEGSVPIIDGRAACKFWTLPRSKQLYYSRKLGENGLEDVFEALADEPLDYF